MQSRVIPNIQVNEVGAISILGEGEVFQAPRVFENVDGKRINDGRYDSFTKEITGGLGDRKCVQWWWWW